MAAAVNAYEANEDLGELTGVSIQHEMHLAIGDWASWSVISKRFEAAGAAVSDPRVTRNADDISVRFLVERVSAHAARALLGKLLDDGLARRGAVEHVLLAKQATGRAQ